MPQKMLYIRDNEETLFQEALRLSGLNNFSSMISEAVQVYVNFQNGFREQYVKKGIESDEKLAKKINFIGKDIGVYDEEDDEGYEIRWVVFLTRKGNIIIWRQKGYVFCTDHRYYIITDPIEDRLLEREALDESEFMEDDNGNLITYKNIMIPEELFPQIKEVLESSDCFLDI